MTSKTMHGRNIIAMVLAFVLVAAMLCGVAATKNTTEEIRFSVAGGKNAMSNARRTKQLRIVVHDNVAVEVVLSKIDSEGEASEVAKGEKVAGTDKNMYTINLKDVDLTAGAYTVVVTEVSNARSAAKTGAQGLVIPKR